MPPDEWSTVFAPAKVNLFLEVIRGRSDGFHEVDTLVQKLDWGDTIRARMAPRDRLEVVGADEAPRDGSNLAWRALLLFREATAIDTPIHLVIEKRIPWGSGLGGGSSDAAAALQALGQLFPPVDRETLASLARRLGSDVPLFLGSSRSRCQGVGDQVTSLGGGGTLPLLVASPGIRASTRVVYEAFRFPRGETPRSPMPLLAALRSSKLEAVARGLFNRLEPAHLSTYPDSLRARAILERLDLPGFTLTGTGGAWVALLPDLDQAEAAAERVRANSGWQAWACRGEASDESARELA